MSPDNFAFCYFCKKSTWLKKQEYKKENVGTVIMTTTTYQGECEICGKLMQKLVINAVEDFLKEEV